MVFAPVPREETDIREERDTSVPAGPRVHFSDEPRTRAGSAQPPPQRRPYFPSDQRSQKQQKLRDLHSSTNALDQATADLLRLSAEPSPVLQRSPRFAKAASTSSVQKVIHTKDGGVLRMGNVVTWDNRGATDSEASEIEMLTSRGRAQQPTHGLRTGGHHSADAVPLSQQNVPATESTGWRDSRSAFQKVAPGREARPTQRDGTETGTAQDRYRSPSSTARKPQEREIPTTRTTRETEAMYEEKVKGPPVVRTTVEGKLRMEKIVGADLITVDSCVSSAWTVKDIVTHYKIKTTIGKRSVIVEENPTGESKYKITLIENGETKAEREAKLDLPEGQEKKDYLTEVSKRLLEDLARLDNDEVTAVTHVEVEVIEDVTNILKTYVIGERADAYDFGVDQVAAPAEIPAIDKFHVEDHVDRTPSPGQFEKSEKIYVDTLEVEDKRALTPERRDIHMEREGKHYEGEGSLARIRRLESEQSIESVGSAKARCAHAFIDCDLIKREDTSDFTVRYAIPLVHVISFVLHRSRLTRQERARQLEMEQSGKRYVDEISMRRLQRFGTAEDEGAEVHELKEHITEERLQHAMMQQQTVIEETLITDHRYKEDAEEHRLRETEAMGGAYGMQMEGQTLKGETVLRRGGRHIESEESEEELVSEKKEIKYFEREAEGGQYSMQQEGMNIMGEKKIRRLQRYESASSEEAGGSPTLVDLTKKESSSFFEIVIEEPNNYGPFETSIKRAQKKKETIDMHTSLGKAAFVEEETFGTCAAKTTWTEAYSCRELHEEHTSSMIALAKTMTDSTNAEAEENLAGARTEKLKNTFKEPKDEQAYLMYSFQNTKKTSGDVDITRQETTLKSISYESLAAESESCTASCQLSSAVLPKMQTEIVRMTPNIAHTSNTFVETSSEHATAVIYLQKRPGLNDEFAEGIAADKRRSDSSLNTSASSDAFIHVTCPVARSLSFPQDSRADLNMASSRKEFLQFSAKASSESNIASTVALNLGARTDLVTMKATDKQKQHITMCVSEFGDAEEHCAVVMKNTGGIHGAASADLPEAVTGESHILQERSRQVEELFVATASKTFSLQNYRTMLPMHGAALFVWPLVVVRAASFHLSILSEYSACRDESLGQEINLRRKDQRADIVVFYVLRRVHSNFMHSFLHVRDVARERELQMQKETLERELSHHREMLQRERHEFEKYRSTSETRSYQTYDSEDYFLDATTTHQITESRAFRRAKIEVLHETENIRESRNINILTQIC